MSWWDRASVGQRLAQIDGGIECGLSASEVKLVLGANSVGAVQSFATYHGRQFPKKARGVSAMHGLRAAYWQGARDFTSAPTPSARVVDADFDEAA